MKSLSSVAGACILAAAMVSAQSRPDLSGSWLPDSSKTPSRTAAVGGGGGGMVAVSRGDAGSGVGTGGSRVAAVAGGGGGMVRAAGGGGAGGAVETRITQSAASLTIERIMGPVTESTTYTFDGSENVNVNGRVTTRSKSRWEGASLVTEGTTHVATDNGEVTSSFREVRSLDTDGGLIVETERVTDSDRRVIKSFYKKQ